MARGKLRIYLGAAPGVGKTFAMLDEGWRRRARGTDVVVAYVETHGRPKTIAQLRDLEVIARAKMTHRGRTFEEMDLDAVLARRPAVALVDELAHTNVSGSRHEKRWQDINALLDAGIDVISTVNVQHLASLNDVVERITGIAQGETVPDAEVRAADQIELVDMAPEALRRRMAHGNIYTPERVDTALAHYFRVGNLTALRELALLWVADRVDDELAQYRTRHGITEPWETKERIVVALAGAPGGEHLLRRAARMAARANGELIGVHVRATDGFARGPSEGLEAQRRLLAETGGRYAEVTGADVAAALVNFARAENATQLILGASGRTWRSELFHGSVINRVVRDAGPIDVHVISAPEPVTGGLPHAPRRRHLAAVAPRRRQLAWLAGPIGIVALGAALSPLRSSLGLPGALLCLLLGVIGVALIGGVPPAAGAAVVATLTADFFFTTPYYTLHMNQAAQVIDVLVFLAAAATVSILVDRLARRSLQVTRAQAEAEALARLAGGSVLSAVDALPDLVAELRRTFDLDGVAVLIPSGGGEGAGGDSKGGGVGDGGAHEDSASGGVDADTHGARSADAGRPPAVAASPRAWKVAASSGAPIPDRPDDAAFSAELDDGAVLVLSGSALSADDTRLLGAFVGQLRVAQERLRLEAGAASAVELAEANSLRGAILAAVSHDLRTPLAAIKAAATSLLSREVEWDPDQSKGFAQTITAESDRLTQLVSNLLDMSRLQAGVLPVTVRPVDVDDVLYPAVSTLGSAASVVTIDVADSLPTVAADRGLFERALANVIDNAITWSPPGTAVRVEAAASEDHVVVRVVDQGPGIPAGRHDEVFQPFQRLGDRAGGSPNGLGLGLAVARGFTQAMGGELTVEDTPGGGATFVFNLGQAKP